VSIIAENGLTLTCKNCGATDCISGDGYDPPIEDVIDWASEFQNNHEDCEPKEVRRG
jgi:hypothetical protein